MKVILDTNALMAVSAFKVDVFSALERSCDFKYTLCVLSGTVKELEKVSKEQRMKYARAAKLALSLLKAKKVTIVKSSGYVDDVLVDYSHGGDLVLTQDVNLKKRLSKPYLTIRQKNRVVVVR